MGSVETESSALETESLSPTHWVGIAAAAVSGLVHLRLGVSFAPSGLGISFLLAGVAFLVAAVLVLVDYRRRTVYAVGVPFVLVQIVAWYYLNFAAGSKSFPADVGTLGAVDKVAQVILVAVLVALLR
jgi:hypothetical protein